MRGEATVVRSRTAVVREGPAVRLGEQIVDRALGNNNCHSRVVVRPIPGRRRRPQSAKGIGPRVSAEGCGEMVEVAWLVADGREAASERLIECFSIPSELRAVREVRRRVGEIARSLCFSSDDVERIQTAVGEAALNGVKHGSPRGGEDRVTVCCFSENGTLAVEVSDSGHGFSPEAVPLPIAENMKPSGYGISLMRGLMDEVSFVPTAAGTTVRLVKRKGTHLPPL